MLTNTMLKRRLPSRDLDNIISRATYAKPATCYTSITGETISSCIIDVSNENIS